MNDRPTKTCPVCNQTYGPRHKGGPLHWGTRIYCSHRCQQRAARQRSVERTRTTVPTVTPHEATMLKLVPAPTNVHCDQCGQGLGAIEIRVPPGALSSPTEVILCADCAWDLAKTLAKVQPRGVPKV